MSTTSPPAVPPVNEVALTADEAALRYPEIVNAAVAIFARDGYAATDVQRIADQARVGKGTVYRHFGNKEQLFLAAARHARRRLCEEVDAAADRAVEPLSKLRDAIGAFVAHFDAHPEIVELLIEERSHFRGRQTPTLFEPSTDCDARWHGLYRELIAQGVLADRPPQQIEDTILRFVFGTMFVNYFAGRTQPLARQCDQLFDVLLRGLGAPQ
jgi:AcrR family transcriptional regulator